MVKLVPDSFLKNKNWTYLWINSPKFYRVCFYCMESWRLLKYIETKLHSTWFCLTLSFFINKKRSGTSHPASFCSYFLKKKNLSLYVLLIEQILLSGCLCFVKYWAIYELELFVNKVLTSWILKLTLSFLIFLIKPFFLNYEKVVIKT